MQRKYNREIIALANGLSATSSYGGATFFLLTDKNDFIRVYIHVAYHGYASAWRNRFQNNLNEHSKS